jgi:hypothetical protein
MASVETAAQLLANPLARLSESVKGFVQGDSKKLLAVLVTVYLLAKQSGGRVLTTKDGKVIFFAPFFL